MSTAETTPPAEPKFETLVAELEKIVGQLEGGQLSLEDSLGAFERGMELQQKAAAILDAAEHKVELLTGTAAAPRTEPFGNS
jgi:exodeoxyribonuclease VII small subunit